MNAVLALVAVVALLVVGAITGWLARDAQMPNCPTEDSCVVDYRDGEWRIERVVP